MRIIYTPDLADVGPLVVLGDYHRGHFLFRHFSCLPSRILQHHTKWATFVDKSYGTKATFIPI